jgi:hypothetical protein
MEKIVKLAFGALTIVQRVLNLVFYSSLDQVHKF